MKSKTIIIVALASLGAIACLFLGMRTVAAGLVHPVENCFRKVGGLFSTHIGGFFSAGAAAAKCTVRSPASWQMRLHCPSR